MSLWEEVRLATLARPIQSVGHAGETVLSVYRDHGVVPKGSREGNHNRTPEDLSRYQLVEPGDVVVNRMKAWQGSLGVSAYRGIVSPDYEVLRLTRSTDARYLHALLRSKPLVGEYALRSVGVRPSQWRLYWAQMRAIRVALPSFAEQSAIADYLDRETARIDALIAKQSALIAGLRTRSSALTESLITSGVGARERAASTIPWMRGALVPTDWRRSRVKFLCEPIRSGEGITAEEIEPSGSYPVYGGNGLRGYASGWTHVGIKVLVGRQGALCGNVHLVGGKYWASEHALVITPSRSVDAVWLSHLLRVMNLGQYSMTAAQPGIGAGQVGVLEVPLPPRHEQAAIASQVVDETAKIDTLIAKAEQFIALARERRSALITAAVTGQIDVGAA